MSGEFPVFDLGAFESADTAGRRELGRQVDAICRSTGFLAVGNHGVPQQIIDAARVQGNMRSSSLPADVKQGARAPYEGCPYGYLGPELEALAKSRGVDTSPDLKRELQRRSARGARRYRRPRRPSASAMRRRSGRRRRTGSNRPGSTIIGRWRIWPNASCGCSRWRSACRKGSSSPISTSRSVPCAPSITPNSTSRRNRGNCVPGAHTDYGSLAILLPQPGSKGLEIQGVSGEWLPVPARVRRLRHQYRRPDGAVDKRPLGFDLAPGGQPAATARWSRAAPVPLRFSTSRTGMPKSAVWNPVSSQAKGRNTIRCAPGPI